MEKIWKDKRQGQKIFFIRMIIALLFVIFYVVYRHDFIFDLFVFSLIAFSFSVAMISGIVQNYYWNLSYATEEGIRYGRRFYKYDDIERIDCTDTIGKTKLFAFRPQGQIYFIDTKDGHSDLIRIFDEEGFRNAIQGMGVNFKEEGPLSKSMPNDGNRQYQNS